MADKVPSHHGILWFFYVKRWPQNLSSILFLVWAILKAIYKIMYYDVKELFEPYLVILPAWLTLVQYWQVVGLLHLDFCLPLVILAFDQHVLDWFWLPKSDYYIFIDRSGNGPRTLLCAISVGLLGMINASCIVLIPSSHGISVFMLLIPNVHRTTLGDVSDII